MSNATDHLALARDYIAIAESADSKREAYMKAADEIIAAQKDDPTLSNRAIGDKLGKGKDFAPRLVAWRTSDAHARHSSPFGGEAETQRKYASHTKQVLANPEQRRQVIAAMPSEQIEAVIAEAHDVAMERLRARHAERDANQPPTARDLMGGEKWDPGESWADTLIMRIDTNTRALENHVRQWGLVIGSLSEDDAFEYVEQSERRLAEVRAALQERRRDRTREGV